MSQTSINMFLPKWRKQQMLLLLSNYRLLSNDRERSHTASFGFDMPESDLGNSPRVWTQRRPSLTGSLGGCGHTRKTHTESLFQEDSFLMKNRCAFI